MTAAPAPDRRAATCPRCGAGFACGADADRASPCSCAGFALGAPRLAELSATWSDCLCASCLAALVDEPERAA